MTKDELLEQIEKYKQGRIDWVAIKEDVEAYSEALIAAKLDVVRSACEHRFVTLVSGGRGLVQCSDCGEVF